VSIAEGQPILAQVLTYLVAVGWVILVMAGIEPDKPLSGGIPGHIEPGDRICPPRGCLRDRMGEIGGWVLFGLAALSLPAILIWVIASHG
jgi:hypothetical protein